MKIQQAKPNQFFVGIPKVLIDALNWERGDSVKFEIMGKDKLKLEKMK